MTPIVVFLPGLTHTARSLSSNKDSIFGSNDAPLPFYASGSRGDTPILAGGRELPLNPIFDIFLSPLGPLFML